MCDARAVSARTMAIARPSWLRLYGVALLMLAALVAVDVISAAGGLRTALEVTVALGGFGAMAGWARRNRAALDLQDWCECASAKTILRVIPSHRPFTATAPDPAAPPRRRYEDVEEEEGDPRPAPSFRR